MLEAQESSRHELDDIARERVRQARVREGHRLLDEASAELRRRMGTAGLAELARTSDGSVVPASFRSAPPTPKGGTMPGPMRRKGAQPTRKKQRRGRGPALALDHRVQRASGALSRSPRSSGVSQATSQRSKGSSARYPQRGDATPLATTAPTPKQRRLRLPTMRKPASAAGSLVRSSSDPRMVHSSRGSAQDRRPATTTGRALNSSGSAAGARRLVGPRELQSFKSSPMLSLRTAAKAEARAAAAAAAAATVAATKPRTAQSPKRRRPHSSPFDTYKQQWDNPEFMSRDSLLAKAKTPTMRGPAVHPDITDAASVASSVSSTTSSESRSTDSAEVYHDLSSDTDSCFTIEPEGDEEWRPPTPPPDSDDDFVDFAPPEADEGPKVTARPTVPDEPPEPIPARLKTPGNLDIARGEYFGEVY